MKMKKSKEERRRALFGLLALILVGLMILGSAFALIIQLVYA